MVILLIIGAVGDAIFGGSKYRCAKDEDGRPSLQESDQTQAARCPIDHPVQWPALMQIPKAAYRARESCTSDSCPVTFLYTGADPSVADSKSAHFAYHFASDSQRLAMVLSVSDSEHLSIRYDCILKRFDPCFCRDSFGWKSSEQL